MHGNSSKGVDILIHVGFTYTHTHLMKPGSSHFAYTPHFAYSHFALGTQASLCLHLISPMCSHFAYLGTQLSLTLPIYITKSFSINDQIFYSIHDKISIHLSLIALG